MTSSPIGLAMLGAGIFAREQHLPAIVACGADTLALRAVYSRSRASSENFVSDAKKLGVSAEISLFYDVDGDKETPGQNLDALLARTDIHAVIIALPILTQPDVIRKCLSAGKHVLSEKPLAGDVKNGVELVENSRKLGGGKALFGIAENYRFEPALQYAADVVASGKLGKTSFFDVRVYLETDQGNKYYQTAWRKNPEYQGGFLLDGGVHHAASLRYVLGVPIDHIACFSRLNREHLAPIDTLHATIRLTDGTTGVFGITFASSLISRVFTVAGDKGSIVIEATSAPAGYKVTVKVDGKTEEKTWGFEGVKNEVKAFAESVRAGALDKRASVVEALLDLAVIESMIESGSKGGQPVKMPTFSNLL